MAELNHTCEYVHQKGDKGGATCEKVPHNKYRRFCAQHHNYLYWRMTLDNEINYNNNCKFHYPLKGSSANIYGVETKEDLYKA